MTNYNYIIEKTKNYYSILLNKSNINKNNDLKNYNLKKTTNVSVNFKNKNISNKDYKKNLLNFSSKKQMSIFINGLDVINKHLNKAISNWPGNKNSNFSNISKIKNLEKQNNNLLPIKTINKYFPNIKNLETKKFLIKNLILKKTNNKIVSVSSFINNNLIFNSRFIIPLTTIKSKNSTFVNKFSDYKLLILLNKLNNYESINTIRNYIKNITNFNSKSAYSFAKNYNYKFNSSTTANNKITKNLYTFLESSFYSMYCLISKPIFIITPDKVVINIFYYSFLYYTKKIHNIFNNKKKFLFKNNSSIFKYKKNILKLKIISQLLAHYFKKPVEFELVILKSPYLNTNILVKLLGFIINKTKLRIIKTNIFSSAKIIKKDTLLSNNNSNGFIHLAGIKVRVAGRLLTQRVIPRKTVKIFNKGSWARGKVIYLETARFTNKNKRGAFSITIFTGHVK